MAWEEQRKEHGHCHLTGTEGKMGGCHPHIMQSPLGQDSGPAGAGNTEMHLKTHRCVCDQREWGERKGITSCRMLRMKYLLNQNKHPLQANYEIFQN